MDVYTPDIERMMKRLFDSLGENNQRRYAAVEATKLGHGGIEYTAKSSNATPRRSAEGWTSWQGQTTWTRIVPEKKGWTQKDNRVSRGPSGNFFGVLRTTAGDPMHFDVKWTNLSRRQSRAGY